MTEQYNAILEILNTDGSDIDDIVKIMKDKYEFNIELDTKPMITKIDPITGEKLIVRQYKKYVSSQKFIRMLEINSIKQISLTATLKNIIDTNINYDNIRDILVEPISGAAKIEYYITTS